jgi:hypothetical protein
MKPVQPQIEMYRTSITEVERSLIPWILRCSCLLICIHLLLAYDCIKSNVIYDAVRTSNVQICLLNAPTTSQMFT